MIMNKSPIGITSVVSLTLTENQRNCPRQFLKFWSRLIHVVPDLVSPLMLEVLEVYVDLLLSLQHKITM